MTEERRLMLSGMPLEDAISICHSLRRERDQLTELVSREETARRLEEERHVCRVHPL